MDSKVFVIYLLHDSLETTHYWVFSVIHLSDLLVQLINCVMWSHVGHIHLLYENA